MPKTEAQIRATTKYESKAYDKILLRLPKGKKAQIQEHISNSGESVNGFICSAIDEKMAANHSIKNGGK